MESWTRPTGTDGSLLEESDVQAEDQDIDDWDEDEDGAALPADGKLAGPLPPAAFADNTPTKCRSGIKRARDAHSDVWKVIKRIVDQFHPGKIRSGVEDDQHHTMWTHVCTSCWTLLRLGWNKSRGMWTTSNANKHLRASPACLLPIMAIASKGMMCATLASSFCERVNSCANMVCTKENSLLSRDEIDMVVTLRMNKRFMKFMRKEFPNLIKDAHPKFGMPVTVQEVMSRLTNQEGVRFVDMS